MSIIIKALTTDDKEEVYNCLKILRNTDANTGFMHESFNVNNANNFSRSWFAWVNTLFGELIVTVSEKFPDLLDRDYSK